MLLRRAASLLSGRSALAQRLPSLVRAPPPLLGGLLHARHVYTPPKAENSPPAPGERLAVLFPRGKRMQVSMEVKKRVLKVRPPSPSPAPSPRLPATAAQPQRAAPTPLSNAARLCPPSLACLCSCAPLCAPLSLGVAAVAAQSNPHMGSKRLKRMVRKQRSHPDPSPNP